jgi:general secretion pathway protein G
MRKRVPADCPAAGAGPVARKQRSGERASKRGPCARSTPRRFAGFSLIELMAVLAILAILAAAAFPLARVATQHSKEQDLRYSLRQLREGIDAYKRAADEGRIAKKAGESGYPKSLDELVAGVDDLRDPNMNKAKIYFLRRIPRDPMAAPGVAAAESWGKRSYASPPDEPREGDDVFDVFSRSETIGLNGIAYRQW